MPSGKVVKVVCESVDIIYYLVVGSGLHTEFRYGLPMQALLFVFAGLTLDWLMGGLRTRTLPNFNLS